MYRKTSSPARHWNQDRCAMWSRKNERGEIGLASGAKLRGVADSDLGAKFEVYACGSHSVRLAPCDSGSALAAGWTKNSGSLVARVRIGAHEQVSIESLGLMSV